MSKVNPTELNKFFKKIKRLNRGLKFDNFENESILANVSEDEIDLPKGYTVTGGVIYKGDEEIGTYEVRTFGLSKKNNTIIDDYFDDSKETIDIDEYKSIFKEVQNNFLVLSSKEKYLSDDYLDRIERFKGKFKDIDEKIVKSQNDIDELQRMNSSLINDIKLAERKEKAEEDKKNAELDKKIEEKREERKAKAVPKTVINDSETSSSKFSINAKDRIRREKAEENKEAEIAALKKAEEEKREYDATITRFKQMKEKAETKLSGLGMLKEFFNEEEMDIYDNLNLKFYNNTNETDFDNLAIINNRITALSEIIAVAESAINIINKRNDENERIAKEEARKAEESKIKEEKYNKYTDMTNRVKELFDYIDSVKSLLTDDDILDFDSEKNRFDFVVQNVDINSINKLEFSIATLNSINNCLKSLINKAEDTRKSKEEKARKEAEKAKLEEMYKKVLEFVSSRENITVGRLQREFRIGYNKAAILVELLEDRGIVGPQKENSVIREVLVYKDFMAKKEEERKAKEEAARKAEEERKTKEETARKAEEKELLTTLLFKDLKNNSAKEEMNNKIVEETKIIEEEKQPEIIIDEEPKVTENKVSYKFESIKAAKEKLNEFNELFREIKDTEEEIDFNNHMINSIDSFTSNNKKMIDTEKAMINSKLIYLKNRLEYLKTLEESTRIQRETFCSDIAIGIDKAIKETEEQKNYDYETKKSLSMMANISVEELDKFNDEYINDLSTFKQDILKRAM